MTEEITDVEIRDPKALLAAYEKAKADLVQLREQNRTLQSQVETLDENKYLPQALTAEAKLALREQGIKDSDRLMKYLDVNGLEFGEDGRVVGLTERLDGLKKDLPELFDVKRQVGGKADIFKNDPVESQPSASEMQVRQLFGE